MLHGAAPETDLHVCPACTRAFVVPVSVVELLDHQRCLVELQCMNCGLASLGAHADSELIELDRRLDEAQDQMREALAIFEVAEDLDAVDRFVRALRDDHVLPEDF